MAGPHGVGGGSLMARQSERAAATREALLSAARDVFTTQGFSEASITEVVAVAKASVGSLYHHFGGKADLYLALFEDYQARQEARASAAVAAARAAGPATPVELFLAGSRAFLEGCWADRALARLFLSGGGPPGFELVSRRRYRDWMRLNELLLGNQEDPPGEPSTEVLVLVLTTVVSEAGAEVAVSDGPERARRVIDDVLTLIGRIAAPQGG
ncbi:MAG TPA: TetR/AcrR family transcriptional regulator [Mycobacteriales bacterium]|nr:TetR/AcrR family transcriptional regulator [Mycobacteriales bacterium]